MLVAALVEVALRLADRQLGLAADALPPSQPPPATATRQPQRLADAPGSCRQPLAIRPPAADLTSAVQTPARWLAPSKRAADAPRVFVVGGSAAFGDGLEYAQTFAAHLAQKLPGDVINAAQNGADSSLVAGMVKTIVDCHDPTAIVVMSGNNEWLYWDFRRQPAWRSGLHEALFDSVAYRYLVVGVRRIETKRRQAEADREDANFFAVQRGCEPRRNWRTPPQFDREAWASLRRQSLAAYALNISESIRYAREHGVEVIVCTVPFRRRMCPAYFIPQPLVLDGEGETEVADAVTLAAQALGAGDPGAARDALADVLKKYPVAPLPRFFAGEAEWAMHHAHAAAMHYRQARENTVGNLGAVLSINDVLRKLAAREQAPLVDLDRLFAEANQTEVDADRLFHDFCHPNAAGHALIARALQSTLTRSASE